MINIIEVFENRELYPTYTEIGVMGDNKATVLRFNFFEKLREYDVDEELIKKIVIDIGNGEDLLEFELYKSITGVYDFEVVSEFTQNKKMTIKLELHSEKGLVWNSKNLELTFDESLPGNRVNFVDEFNNKIGDLSKLETQNKNSLVEAINEVNGGGGGSNYIFGDGLAENDGLVYVDFEQVADAYDVPISADVIGNTLNFRGKLEPPTSVGNQILFSVDLPTSTGGGGGFTVDGTLTQGGTAADAKAVGDRLSAVEHQTVTTDVAYEHTDLPVGEKTVIINGDGTFGDTAFICTGTDLIPREKFNKSFPFNGITITKQDYTYHITGTATATTTILLGDVDGDVNVETVKDLNGQTLKLITFAEELLGSNIRVQVQFYDENGADLSGQIKKPITATTNSNISDIVVPDGSAYMRIGLVMLKEVAFDNKVQIYLSLNDEIKTTTEFDDVVIENFDTDTILTFPYPSVINTRLSLKSYINYIADSSDNLIDLGEGTITYLTPEDFGAKGDGKTDDSEAINLCLERASSTRKLVLMAQKYYVTTPIIIGSNVNVTANQITYSGTDTAIRIDGKRNTIKIHSISSSAVGIIVGSTNGVANLYNIIEVNNITTQSHGIVFNASSASMWQNTIKFSCITAGGTGCYGIADLTEEGNGYFVAETNVYGGQITNCEWAVYKCKGNSRFYNIQIEGNVQGGFYINSGCTVFHPRIAESQRDGTLPIYKFSNIDHSTIYDSSGIYINQIDLSEATELYNNGLISEYHFGTINGRIISSNIEDGKPTNTASVYSTKTYLWGRYLIFTPFADYIKVVTTNVLDTRLVGSETTPAEIREMTQLPTKFVVDNVNSEIYLHSSYCAFGYNEFEVEQANGFTCKVYDVKGTLIFDGTACDNGVYKFKVYKDAQYCKQNSSGVLAYDFLGHYWEIKKSSDIVI